MFKQIGLKIILFIIIIYLTSCSTSPITNDTSIEDLSSFPTKTIVATQTITNIVPMMTEIPTLMLTPNATPRATSITADIPVPDEEFLQPNCPTNTQNQSPLWSQGSILFGKGRIFSEDQVFEIAKQPGIWAISSDSLQPYLVYEVANSVFISPDGTTLLNITLNIESNTQRIILYNLISGSETLLEPYDDYLFAELWSGGGIQYGDIVERTEGVGIKQLIYIPNSDTKTIEKVVEEIKLPDFAFNDSELDRGNFFGYESIDPTGQIILYTAYGSNKNSFEVRLLNLETGEILWRHDTQYLPDAFPQWSEDGSRVLFVVSIPATNTQPSWWKIISLTREGKVVELPPQPFPSIKEGQLNHFSRSPNGQYLFYTAFEVDVDNLNSRNRAFIINIETGEIGEICDSETTFIASVPARDLAGHWLLDDQFVYRVLVDKGGQPTHSLRVLDIPSWTTQTIFEANAGQGVNVFGWTPVEVP